MATLGTVSSFGNIKGPDVPDFGAFKVSNELFGWKNKRTGEVLQHRSSDVSSITFVKTNSNLYQLRIELNESKQFKVLRFDGFTEKVHIIITHQIYIDTINVLDLSKHFEENYKMSCDKDEVSCTGWHWGTYEFDNTTFRLRINNNSGLEIDAQSIIQATIPSKTDLAIELKNANPLNNSDDLVEIRFCVPSKLDPEDAEIKLEDLKQTFLVKSGLDEMKSEKIALLMDIPLIVPRGRYEIEFTKRSIKLHGKSYDYTLLFTNIIRMFLLPKPNSPYINFILGLSQSMRQGQTRYAYIVMQFESDHETKVDLNLQDNDLKQYKLDKVLEGKTYNVVSRLFGSLVNRSIVVPGDFKSEKGDSAISCTYKATSGHLFPLNRSLLFIVKPVIFIRFEDIVSVEFSRTGVVTQNRFFAILVSMRGGIEYEFTNIDKTEFKNLNEYLMTKDIKVKTSEETERVEQTNYEQEEEENEEDDEEDEDFQDESEESEEEE
ncbi:structure-specific recognition protein (SSRP) 1, putative [Theileria annulata]|uniref:FACT complex subunit SSRP1 n=1 Tax=Theileria annulata TaxID=5874 RepID=Q4UAH0_THEAN|nr:structure-specific recognition protein (SSRP) 1, putative [Theileria annulata]CAI76181.1 structure-specific recognition protein (SSRP) 1, putative [Theileria annulata]|eukprot:XP_952806.1 structure-specific recognition protein (SSRP) 1, putative [Theileria annulata]